MVALPIEEDWVSSQEKLSKAFSCHSHSFPRWRTKFPDAPKPRQNGDHSITQWREFFQRHPDIELEGAADRKSILSNAILEQKLADMRRESAVASGKLISVAEVEAWIAEKIEQQRQLLQQIYERDLPPKLEGLRVPQIVEKMIDARNRIQKPMQDLAKQIAAKTKQS